MGACRLLPHGSYALLAAVLSTLAWLASLFQDGCDYARLTGPKVQDITQDPDVPFLQVGFAQYQQPYFNGQTWQVASSQKCQNYNFDAVQLDGKWKAAKGFAFCALVLGGGGSLFLWFSTCFVFAKGTWRWAGYEVLLASIFQALSFLWFGTEMCSGDNACGLYWGSRADIVATVFWFVAAVAIFLKYPIPKGDDDVDGNDEEEQQEMAPPSANGLHRSGVEEDNLTDGQLQESDDGQLHLMTDVPLEGDATARLPGQSGFSNTNHIQGLEAEDRTEPEVV